MGLIFHITPDILTEYVACFTSLCTRTTIVLSILLLTTTPLMAILLPRCSTTYLLFGQDRIDTRDILANVAQHGRRIQLP